MPFRSFGEERLRDPRAALAGAKRGSIPDVISITASLITGDCSDDNRPIYINAVFDAINVFRNSRPDQVPQDAIHAAQNCVFALVQQGFDFYKNKNNRPLLDRLRSCFSFIHEQVVYNLRALASYGDKAEAHVSEQLLQSNWTNINFTLLAAEDGDQGHLWADEESFIVAARVWLAEWTPQGNSLASKILSACIPSCDPRSVTPRSDERRKTLLDVATSRLNLSADDIICLALARLRRADVNDLAECLGIVTFLIGGTNPDNSSEIQSIQRAFERHRGASVLLRSLNKILKSWDFDLKEPNSSHVDMKHMPLLSRCLKALLLGLAQARSLVPLKQALNRDLIRLLACCSTQCVYSHLTPSDKDIITSILLTVLGEAFFIRHMVQMANRAVAKYQNSMGRAELDEYTLSGVFPSLKTADNRDVWEKFFRRLHHQISSFQTIARERREEIHACGNPSCNVRETKSELYRCAGCYVTLFCTRKCQSIAWRGYDHKAHCSRYRNTYDTSGLSHKNVDFLIRFAHEEARRRLCAALSQAPSPKLPENFGLFVSFTGAFQGGLLKMHDGELASKASMLPYYPSRRNSGIGDGGEDDDDEMQTVLKITYGLGSDERSMHVKTSIGRAACEGRECACCRFHAEDGAGSKNCWEEIDQETCSVHSGV